MRKLKKVITCLIILFIVISASFHWFTYSRISLPSEFTNQDNVRSSGQRLYTKQWLKNNNFSTQDNWFLTKGDQGDNSTVNGTISGGYANYKILGDNQTIELSDPLNDGSWQKFRNDIFLYPDTSTITADGIYVTHDYDESVNQSRNYHSAHWRKNISLGLDMSKFNIKSAFLNVTFNASVQALSGEGLDGLDVIDEGVPGPPLQFGIGDFVRFYVLISDIEFKNPYTVALNRTTDLGIDSAAPTDYITDSPIYSYGEDVIITALNSAFDKDPSHSNFTITLGIDIYCEDNWINDRDLFNYLYIKDYNLTFTYEKKTEKFTSISWSQEGNKITGANIQILNATFNFKVKISDIWSSALSPFSEIRILINDNPHTETIRLISLNKTFDMVLFDVTNLIVKEVNITPAIQVFIADTFSLGKNITISIDDVFLNISYYETFPDYTTDIDLFLNKVNKTQDKVIQIPINNILNVTIKYTNQSTGFHISNATVQLEGDFSGSLNENLTLEQYSIIFNTSQLSIGIKTLTVEAKKDNYFTKPIQFFVTVVERSTELLLFVDNNQINDGDTINSGVNEFLNITANFRDNSTKNFLSGASVELLSVDNLTETSNYYNITINTSELNQGINVLIILAQLSNYTSQTFQFFIELVEGASELLLFVNNTQTYDSDTVTVKTDEILNLAIVYQDNFTKAHLSGANVVLLSVGNLVEVGSLYVITINTNNLNLGTTILTISAQLNNYLSQTIRIYVELSERATELYLFLNSENKTLDPVIELPMGSILNITAEYIENQTKRHLNNASLHLIGENLLINLTENLVKEHYSILINTTDLKIGVNLLTITAYATNYQIGTIDIRITINKISTIISTISGEPIINIIPGNDIKLQIMLNNSDFGTMIKNATVTYRWTYGQGVLTDQDNDGIYEADLLEIPEGSYTITITASAGDDYDFKSYEITVSAVREPKEDQIWLIYVLTGGIVGLISVFSVYQFYFKYPPLVRKIRKLRKSIRKGKKIKPMMISKREETINLELQNLAKILDLESKKIENKIPDKIEKNIKKNIKENE